MPARPQVVARPLALAAVAGALAAPAAVARPIDTPYAPLGPDLAPSAAVESTPAPAAPPIVRSVDDGFDWGSAAIGAGGAGAVFVLASLGGFTYTSRHRIGAAR